MLAIGQREGVRFLKRFHAHLAVKLEVLFSWLSVQSIHHFCVFLIHFQELHVIHIDRGDYQFFLILIEIFPSLIWVDCLIVADFFHMA
jgi:hypothetical protein